MAAYKTFTIGEMIDLLSEYPKDSILLVESGDNQGTLDDAEHDDLLLHPLTSPPLCDYMPEFHGSAAPIVTLCISRNVGVTYDEREVIGFVR